MSESEAHELLAAITGMGVIFTFFGMVIGVSPVFYLGYVWSMILALWLWFYYCVDFMVGVLRNE